MPITFLNMRSTAVAALMSLPLAGGPALAQQAPDTTESQGAAQQAEDAAQNTAQDQAQPAEGQQSQPSAEANQTTGAEPADALVATVGDAEIRRSDLMTAIGQLPPQLQSQPPQMLVPLALQQLVLRELILDEARSQNLAEDPEVQALVESSTQVAEEDAMVRVWLDREFKGVVTDEAVQQVYDDLQADAEDELPAIEELRPQIEQHLRQQAMQGIQTRLSQGAEIVLYGPGGEPLDPQPAGAGQQEGEVPATGAEAQDTAPTAPSENEATGQPGDTTGDPNQGN